MAASFGNGDKRKATGQCRTNKQITAAQNRKSRTSPQMKKQLRKKK